ncbi:LCP family protein [Patescibacteria group bacterium]|nr:LCP family protein [Patescibacteria group bacterium]
MRKYLKYLGLVALFTTSFVVGLAGGYFLPGLSKIFVKKENIQTPQVVEKLDVLDSYNILLLGYGGAGHDGGNLSDVVMVLNVNPKEKKAVFVSIPRDLWVEIPVRSDLKEHHKINAAYAIGSDDKKFPLKEPQYKGESGAGTMAKEVVGEVIGVPIEYFIAVDFEGFKKIADTLGGVDVDVPVTFDDYFYPVKGLENETCGKTGDEITQLHQKFSGFDLEKQFECRYEHIHYDKGKNHMDGESVLKFVRSRHSNEHGGDFARSQRQQAVILALKEKLLSLNSAKNFDDIYKEFTKMLRTDLDLKKSKDLASIFGEPEDYKISFLSLSTDNVLVATKSLDGQFILIPKEGEGVWTGIQKFIFDQPTPE